MWPFRKHAPVEAKPVPFVVKSPPQVGDEVPIGQALRIAGRVDGENIYTVSENGRIVWIGDNGDFCKLVRAGARALSKGAA